MHFANAPGQSKFRSELLDQLLVYCGQNLPQQIAPRDITLVDTLAGTTDGEFDPKELVAARDASL